MNEKKPIPIAFFGTPEFSVPILKALHESPEFDIKIVVSQPDRPSGRHLKLTPSPVKMWAENEGLMVVTPESCKTEEFIDKFRNLKVKGAVVVAFGQILNQKLLNTCPDHFINIHASLLPRWRGAAPIQRAIMSGDLITGVSAQVMVKKLDAGDVIFEVKTEIKDNENSVALHDRLSSLSAEAIVSGLMAYFNGRSKRQIQDESLVNYAAKIEKNETWIDWTVSSRDVWNHIRGLALGPGGATQYKNKRLKIINAKPFSSAELDDLFTSLELNYIHDQLKPGEIIAVDARGFYVMCGEKTCLHITEVQPESKPIMKSRDFINGAGLKTGDFFDFEPNK